MSPYNSHVQTTGSPLHTCELWVGQLTLGCAADISGFEMKG